MPKGDRKRKVNAQQSAQQAEHAQRVEQQREDEHAPNAKHGREKKRKSGASVNGARQDGATFPHAQEPGHVQLARPKRPRCRDVLAAAPKSKKLKQQHDKQALLDHVQTLMQRGIVKLAQCELFLRPKAEQLVLKDKPCPRHPGQDHSASACYSRCERHPNASHAKNRCTSRSRRTCFQFRSGNCMYGDSCRFAHEGQSQDQQQRG